MKEGFPKIVAEGPVGPYEVLNVGPVPSLVVFQTSDSLFIAGDRTGLERLARLADLVRDRRDTVVHFPLRANAMPSDMAPYIVDPGLLDLVLAPKQVAMTPKVWKEVRAMPSPGRRRVTLPELDDTLDGARERLEFRQKTRGMDRHVGAATLILSGENTAFRALAGAAAYVARVGSGWQNWEEYHVDWFQRDDERNVMVNYYDASRDKPL